MTYYLSKSEWLNSKIVPEGMNLEMLNMEGRTETLLKPAIESSVKDQIFIDLGCGTGLLGLYALEKGAKFVYFVEQDDQMVHILENVLPKKIKKSCYKIIHKDIENLNRQDFYSGIPDIAASEFYGPRLFDEGYVNYTKHLKNLFPNLKFIPEIFVGRFYLSKINYKHPIWPKDKSLIEYFHFMYKSKSFAQYLDNVKTGTQVGEILFNANTQEFKNSLEFKYLENKDNMLLGKMFVEHNELTQFYTHIGWVLDKNDYGNTFRIYFDGNNYFNPIKENINIY